ncbi:hypothetical protein COSHB9_24360 [Companilactobacillus alimentarius]|uniref:AraC family transcriptional regulator n=1 Tax=Companilactobacillus alimentarius TaxID=1602 RepID=UPI0028B3BF82|nr:AraC family transcriptional regulator [Companilactobacillus alimentarius]MDT6951618.1 AraC family transcriptional regulator [Companilactobacillus alimentarius]
MKITDVAKSFFEATNLSTFVFNSQDQAIATFKMPIAPQLPTKLANKLLMNISQKISIHMFLRIGSIATFQIDHHKVVVWATSNMISGNGKYDDKVPLIDFHTFEAQLTLFYLSLTQSTPKFTESQLSLSDFDIIDRPNQEFESFNIHKPSHNGYLAEQQMLLGVEHGNLKEFNNNYVQFMDKGNFGILATSDLRSKKNITVAATTLFTRGGMYAENAYDLSDECIKKTELKQNITNIYEYTRTIGERFVKNVAQIKRKNIPFLIYRTQEYIYDNLATVKNIDEIAQEMGCSKSYLIHLFKRTTGVSIIEFLTSQRILSAKQLLLFTQLSVYEIANTLGYNGTSQFSRTFKNATGISPSQFKKNQNL